MNIPMTISAGSSTMVMNSPRKTSVDTRAVGLGPHADHDVISKSHDRGARDGFDASLAPSGLRRACVDDAPPALVDHRERGIVGRLHGRIGPERTDVRIGGALLFGGIEARIGNGVGVAYAQPRQRLVPWRISRIRSDVVDPGQPIRLESEIGRVGEERERDRHRRQRGAYPRQPLHPDHDEGGEGEHEGHDGNGERARKGCERGSDFEQARTHDNDREEGGYESKCGHAPRPDGEP